MKIYLFLLILFLISFEVTKCNMRARGSGKVKKKLKHIQMGLAKQKKNKAACSSNLSFEHKKKKAGLQDLPDEDHHFYLQLTKMDIQKNHEEIEHLITGPRLDRISELKCPKQFPTVHHIISYQDIRRILLKMFLKDHHRRFAFYLSEFLKDDKIAQKRLNNIPTEIELKFIIARIFYNRGNLVCGVIPEKRKEDNHSELDYEVLCDLPPWQRMLLIEAYLIIGKEEGLKQYYDFCEDVTQTTKDKIEKIRKRVVQEDDPFQFLVIWKYLYDHFSYLPTNEELKLKKKNSQISD